MHISNIRQRWIRTASSLEETHVAILISHQQSACVVFWQATALRLLPVMHSISMDLAQAPDIMKRVIHADCGIRET